MKIDNLLKGSGGHFYRYRRRHPQECLTGMKGVFAFLSLEDFSDWSVLYVQASNDLGEVEGSRIEQSLAYREACLLGRPTVAIYVTGSARGPYRTTVADSIVEANDPPLNRKLAA